MLYGEETLMSKGPGRIRRAIEAIFAAAPDDAFTVDELCLLVFDGIERVEKKHRVSVLRAAKASPDLMAIYEGKILVFFRIESVKGYGMARLKPTPLSNEQIRARLEPGGDQYDAVV